MADANTLTITNIQLYIETLGLLNAYNRVPEWRATFKSRILEGKKNYNGRPLRSYVWLLAQINPLYNEDWVGTVQPERFLEILEDFYNNPQDRQHLEDQVEKLKKGEIDHPDFISKDDHEKITKADSQPEADKKEQSLDQFVEEKSQSHAQEIPAESQATSALPGQNIGLNQMTGSGAIGTPAQTQITSNTPTTPQLDQTPGSSPIPSSFSKSMQGNLPLEPMTHVPAPGSAMAEKVGGTSPIPEVFTKSFEKTPTEISPTPPHINQPLPRQATFSQPPGLGAMAQRASGINIPRPQFPVSAETGVKRLISSGGNGILRLGSKFANGAADGISALGQSKASLGRGLGSIGRSGRGFAKKRAVFLLIFLFFGLSLFAVGFSPPNQSGIPGTGVNQNLQISKTGDAEVAKGGIIDYKITVTYTGTGQADIQITDTLPDNLTPLEAKGGAIDQIGSTNIAKWDLKGVLPNQAQTVALSVQAPNDNVWIQNTATATITSSSGGSTTIGPGTPPNSDTCGGKYTSFRTPVNNFGDPQCTFVREKLYDLLKQQDPTDADYWYYTVVRLESGWDPNNYNGTSTSGSAWGLYQMGHEAYPQLGISRQMNNQNDRGDVPWENQTSNAINTKKASGWGYWAAAKDRW